MKKSMLYRFKISLLFIVSLSAATYVETVGNNVISINQSLFQGTQLVRAYFTNKEMAHKALVLFEVEVLEISYEDRYLVLDATPEDIAALTEMHFDVVPYPEYDFHHNSSKGVHQTGTIPNYPSYKIVEKTFAIAESLCTAFPDLATWIDAGDSWEKTQGSGGYDMNVLRLTNSKIAGPKPKLFITAGMHGREYTPPELLLRLVLNLLRNYGKNADATWMLDHQELHAMFYANPDGRKLAETGIEWRKNTNKKYCPSNANMRGCDINGNFDCNWTPFNDECNEAYPGSSAASEPETQAIQNYLKKEFTDTNSGIYIDLHSKGGLILQAANTPELKLLGDKISHFNGYSVIPVAGNFIASNSYQYGYYVAHVASYLIEVGTAWFQDCNSFENKIVPDNLGALTYAFRVCRSMKKIPAGPDALDVTFSNKVLNATINDTLYCGSNGAQNIKAAEYYINTPPWAPGAVAVPMTATDGSFNSAVEKVTATISRNDLQNNKVIIYVRGKDSAGNWGSVSAAFSDQTSISCPIFQQHGSTVTVQYPNPLSLRATIMLKLQQSAHTRLTLYSVSGRSVATLTNSVMAPGVHAIQWCGKDDAGKTPAQGIYLFRLQVNNFTRMDRILLVK